MLLRSFVTIAQTGSFSIAAARLNLTQSTVSHQVARLERQLGKRLFKRTTRSCEITGDGRALLVYAKQIILSLDEMERSLRPHRLKGSVTIGVPDDRHLFVSMTKAITSFMAAHPDVAIEVRAGLSADLTRGLSERQIDVAVLREIPARLGSHTSSLEQLVWVSGERWDPLSGDVLPLALVGDPCSYRRTALAALDAAGRPWKALVTCTNLEAALSVVEANAALTVIAQGDLRTGVRVAADATLPALPASGLRLQFAREKPSVAARVLADMLTKELGLRR